MYSEADFIPIK